MKRAVVVGLAVLAMSALGPTPADAHPLGNFSRNTHASLAVSPGRVRLDYVLDLAEVPTLQAQGDIDGDNDGEVGSAESQAWADQRCGELVSGLRLGLGGDVVRLSLRAATLSFPPGNANLRTTRLECATVSSPIEVGGGDELVYSDTNEVGDVGWHEIIAQGDGVTLVDSTVAERSLSDELRRYPDDLRSPLDQRSATLELRPGGASLVPGDDEETEVDRLRGADRLTTAFTDLVDGRRITPLFALGAFLLAMVLGAAHALAPGHGKTLMAAYVVGRDGTVRQLSAIGATVAVTHTGGVLLLGLLVSASTTVAPEQVLHWAGVASGALLAAVGVALLLSRRRGGAGHLHLGGGGHTHGPGGGHTHGHESHDHGSDSHSHRTAPVVADPTAHAGATTAVLEAVDHDHDRPHEHEHEHQPDHAPARHHRSWRSVVAMGFAGGLVPSPSALVVLLGATALGQVWFGVLLVLAYGVGMAATLVAAGLLLLRTRGRLERWAREGRWAGVVTRLLPMATASFLIVGGVFLALRAAAKL